MDKKSTYSWTIFFVSYGRPLKSVQQQAASSSQLADFSMVVERKGKDTFSFL